jgi:1-phosphatidylinositol-3-phosphate 5-kinase
MIESLARCFKWDASGGKSGSAFLKTRGEFICRLHAHSLILYVEDDRFIAKELSKPELQTMETFAPSYFDYMSSAVSANVSLSHSFDSG